MMYLRSPLSLRQVEDLLHECSIGICHETVSFRENRFGPMFAVEKEVWLASVLFELAFARGRGVPADQRRDALPLAGGGSRG
jgi:hypothetical protein